MKSYIQIVIGLFFSTQLCFAGNDLQLKKISDKVYLYTSWSEIEGWGRVGSNGLIVIGNDGKGLLLDTPMEESKTVELLDLLRDSLQVTIVAFVPGHWHTDCVGGLAYLNKIGVKTHAHKMTNDFLKQHNRPTAQQGFSDFLSLKVGGVVTECYFLGGGHTADNIVAWIPSEKMLFGGCMLKECGATSVGNVEDAVPLNEWLRTVLLVEDKFKDVKTVIPGHGQWGGNEILEATIKLLEENIDR